MESVKFVTSVTWIKRGVCQEKAKEDSDEMQTDEFCEDEEENETDDEEGEEEEDEDEEEEDAVSGSSSHSEIVDSDDEFDFKNYDDEDDVQESAGFSNDLTYFAKNELDPYMTRSDEDDMSDIDDKRIKPDDNVIVIANITKDCSTLDFYVYNEEQDDCFIHHSIPLLTVPVCTEWVGYRADTAGAGNFLAVGNLTSKIEFWEVDDANSLEPTFTLGRKTKKKNSKKAGHTDAVLDLAWNSTVGNVIASGSADSTVVLWDILSGKGLSTMSQFESKVQSLQWHPFESNNLLSGSCDKKTRLFDCREPKKACREWLCDGEVERVLWNHFDPFYCLASTDGGMVHCFDARAKASVWTLGAHPSAAVTGLSLSSSCPGCLITASTDESIKVWDILDKKPGFVYEQKLTVKRIIALSGSPDSPFVVSCGGDNKNHNFKLVDLSRVEIVMKKFRGRPLVCVDRSTTFVSEEEPDVSEADMSSKSSRSKQNQTKKKEKKKRKQ